MNETIAQTPAIKRPAVTSFRATGANGAYSYGDTPRQAAERFFERFDTRRKCDVIEGRIEGHFFSVTFRRGDQRPQRWENVTKAGVSKLPGNT